jgi:hypothetical protein
MKKLLLILFLIIVVAGFIRFMSSPNDPIISSEDVRVEFPEAYERVTSPLVVRGEAKGSWFFEADFPLVLLDANGKELAQGYAITSEEWMTSDFVSFESIPLVFTEPETETGFLILFKNNPSDITELDDRVAIPIQF